ncbi:MAG: alpha-L-fucosidase [Candidatus Glassbacteria bacterium]|nr:alpha-L-fucosidase [Candidatus Glassbacteria bacterium]
MTPGGRILHSLCGVTALDRRKKPSTGWRCCVAKHNRTVAVAFCLLLAAACGRAAEQGDLGYTPAPENLEARQWFQDAKFGLFIHWGVYSLLGRGEWVMHVEDIPIAEYEKLPPQFDPTGFDPDEWCRMAADAGMRYITITSKHHDGFAMFDSKVSDYDIVERTPYGRDVLKMLAGACERHGLKLFFYHSQLDWHHPDYYPRGGSYSHGRPESGDWQRYLDYMDSQLTELCTGYGKLGGIWFDGMWEKPEADWRLGRTYRLIHRLQPQALIGSNHHVAPFPGEDFQMFEKGLPGRDPFNKGAGISALPLETCETINHSWGYDRQDHWPKSTRELLHYLIRAAGNNANFLLNVGPKPDGTIQQDHRKRLEAMGQWLRKYGDTVYGTRGGPFAEQSWGVSTVKGGRVFLHVLGPDAVITLPEIGRPVRSAALLDKTPLELRATPLGTVVKMPENRPDEYDTIVEVELE